MYKEKKASEINIEVQYWDYNQDHIKEEGVYIFIDGNKLDKSYETVDETTIEDILTYIGYEVTFKNTELTKYDFDEYIPNTTNLSE